MQVVLFAKKNMAMWIITMEIGIILISTGSHPLSQVNFARIGVNYSASEIEFGDIDG